MSFQPVIHYNKAEFIETVSNAWKCSTMLKPLQDTGNKVSRKAIIAGPQNIILGGKTIISQNAIIRGDLRRTGPGTTVVISIGRYCVIGEGCIVRSVSCKRLT
jgi:dynactin-5